MHDGASRAHGRRARRGSQPKAPRRPRADGTAGRTARCSGRRARTPRASPSASRSRARRRRRARPAAPPASAAGQRQEARWPPGASCRSPPAAAGRFRSVAAIDRENSRPMRLVVDRRATSAWYSIGNCGWTASCDVTGDVIAAPAADSTPTSMKRETAFVTDDVRTRNDPHVGHLASATGRRRACRSAVGGCRQAATGLGRSPDHDLEDLLVLEQVADLDAASTVAAARRTSPGLTPNSCARRDRPRPRASAPSQEDRSPCRHTVDVDTASRTLVACAAIVRVLAERRTVRSVP